MYTRQPGNERDTENIRDDGQLACDYIRDSLQRRSNAHPRHAGGGRLRRVRVPDGAHGENLGRREGDRACERSATPVASTTWRDRAGAARVQGAVAHRVRGAGADSQLDRVQAWAHYPEWAGDDRRGLSG